MICPICSLPLTLELIFGRLSPPTHPLSMAARHGQTSTVSCQLHQLIFTLLMTMPLPVRVMVFYHIVMPHRDTSANARPRSKLATCVRMMWLRSWTTDQGPSAAIVQPCR
jgi:hypothetical protein